MIEPLIWIPQDADGMLEKAMGSVCEMMGVPKRIFVGSGGYAQSGLMSDLFEERDAKRMKQYQKIIGERVIEPIAEECWYQVNRVKHTSVGQEKRDFFRALAKLNGIKQVTNKVKVVWQ